MEYNGNDIDCPRKDTPQQCREVCKTFSNCAGWAWGYGMDQCCAKTEVTELKICLHVLLVLEMLLPQVKIAKVLQVWSEI